MPRVHITKDEAGWWTARLPWDSDIIIEARAKTLQAVLRRLADNIVEEQFVEVITTGEATAA